MGKPRLYALAHMGPRLFLLGRDPEESSATTAQYDQDHLPDWAQADPRRIDKALTRALAQPSGGWVVVDATRELRRGPRKYTLCGQELVAWWDGARARVAPESCPHMGAELSTGHVDAAGRIVCPWHGLALGERKHGSWQCHPTHDDGVLTWVRMAAALAPGEQPTERPFLCERPAHALDAVIRMEGRCEARDVIANRLDPWHGAHFHNHSFARLRVIDEGLDHITVRVVYRIAGSVGMEVDARFTCPDPRTIVMTIIAGDGVGSVVETHATPIAEGRAAIVEATLATSDRPIIGAWLPRASFLRPFVAQRARKLWVDDVAYCERLYALRKQAERTATESVARLQVLRNS